MEKGVLVSQSEQEQNSQLKEEELKSKARSISVKEGAAYGIMDCFGLNYITPFALYLGASASYVGVLSSVPNLLGNFSQIFSSRLIEKSSRKKIVVISVLIQALLWLPLIALGALFYFNIISSGLAVLLMIVLYSILVTAGSFGNPVWSSWMKDLISANSGAYFAKRNKVENFVVFAGMIVAGLVLDYFKKTSIFTGFTILFLIAFLGRSVSTWLLSRQYEPKLNCKAGYYFSFFDFVKKMRHNNYGKYVIFTTLILFATAIASPFFSVYMLKDLHLSYLSFTIITFSSLVAKVATYSFWGRVCDKYGNVKVMMVASWMIPLVPLIWMSAPLLPLFVLVPGLVLFELFSGFCWAAFNLATGNFLFDAVTRERAAICRAYENSVNAIGTFLGATIGSIILLYNGTFFGINIILFVFLLSGILRFAVPIFMGGLIKEVRSVENIEAKDIMGHIRKRVSKIKPKLARLNIF